MSREKPYGLTRPCAKCPFRSDIRPYLTPERVTQMARDLQYGEFYCHETLDYTGGEGGKETPKTAHCAGALILMERMNKPSQMMRIAERLGMYDASKLDMTAPVFDSWKQMHDAQVRGQRGDEATMSKKRDKAGKDKASTGTSGTLWDGRRETFPGHFRRDTGADDWARRFTMGGRDRWESRGLLDCIFCGTPAAGTVQGHATCSKCKRKVTKMLGNRSRTVRTKEEDVAVFTWETRLNGKVSMGTIHVETIAGPNGGRVNMEIVKGDQEVCPRPSRWNIMRADTARALARFLLDAAELADNTPPTSAEKRFAQEPDEKDRVTAREVAFCGICKIRPAMAEIEGAKVCEKCRADVVIDADRKAAGGAA